MRRQGWAAWLGAVAIALNLLVPIHLAFDLAEAFETAPRDETTAAVHGPAWHVLAALSGHAGAGHHGKHGRPDCPVCSALGSLAGFAPASAPLLPAPTQAAAILPAAASIAAPAGAPDLSYRSRAPPLA